MSSVKLTINGRDVRAPAGASILEAARAARIYIPALCYHPDLPVATAGRASSIVFQGGHRLENAMPEEPGKSCGLCVVEVAGEPDLVGSCTTQARDGMVVTTESDRIQARRQENLVPILANHPHACLTCTQQEGCARTQCSSNVPQNERCCDQFGHCELQNVANYIGISDATPRWVPTRLPVFTQDPLYKRDYNLCIGCTRCVRACRDLRGVQALGFVYDQEGRVHVGTIAPTPQDSGCKFCTACVEVCPTGALTDKQVRAGRKEEDLVPCTAACPAHVDIPGYIRLIAQGRVEEAHSLIREKVPFPGILGRVCIHPCEDVCRREEVNEPMAICALKRYASDREKGLWKERTRVQSDTGKRVAVVGSGPAGLTAAFYLRKQGHSVTLFESREQAGGMMRYGIPPYRLPREILNREIQEILDLGVEFKPNMTLGKDLTLGQLKENGFDAVFLGLGAQLSRRLPLDGADLPDLMWGLDLLAKIARGEKVWLKEKVVVIGGGNVAIDAARTALRSGARDVTILYRRSVDEMPATPGETRAALDEGIKVEELSIPVSLIEQCQGRDKGVCCLKAEPGPPDQSGRPSPVPVQGSQFEVGCDQIIVAIGQDADLSFAEGEERLTRDKGLIVVEHETLETGMQGVYAGGDMVQMPRSVIHAIAAGRKAASSIDKMLGGTGEIDEVLFERAALNQHLGRDEGFTLWSREKVPEIDVESRRKGFQEVSLGLADDQALKEAKRCLQCDLRLHIRGNPSPPQKWLAFREENVLQIPEEEGVFQLLDQEHNVLVIKGTANLRESLREQLAENEKAAWFDFEEDKMYTQRESELIQQYLQEHGQMPGAGEDDLDDLF